MIGLPLAVIEARPVTGERIHYDSLPDYIWPAGELTELCEGWICCLDYRTPNKLVKETNPNPS